MGNVVSELARLNIFAESDIKSWLNMDKKIYWLIWEMYDLNQADRTLSQNQKLKFGSVWTIKCIDFIWEI